jgi:nitrate reductase beta subunit
MTGERLYDMYRLLAVAKAEDRYVIPTAHHEPAGHEPTNDVHDGCSLDTDGGPGMGGPPAGRINLLNWNGQGRPDGLFPRGSAR